MKNTNVSRRTNTLVLHPRWWGSFLCFFLVITALFSQSYDETIKDLRTQLQVHIEEDEKRVDLYNELSYAYRRSAPTKIDSFAKAAFALASKLDYTKGLAIAHKNLGIAIIKNGGTPEETSEQIRICIKLAEECKDYYTQAACLNNLALGDRNNLEYALAIQNFLKALEIHEEHFSVDRLRMLLIGNIGKTYVSLGDYENAEKYLDQTIKLAEEHNQPAIIAMYTENLTIIKYKKGKKKEAIQILEEHLPVLEEIKDVASYIDVSLLLSEFLLNENQIERAGIYIDKASRLSDEFNFKLQSCKADLLESRLLASYRNWNKAEELGLGAHACATDRMDITQQLASAKNLLDISLNTNNTVQAKEFLKVYEGLLETQFDVEQQKSSARLEVEYQNQRREAENTFLKSQKEKNEATIKRQRFLGLLIFLLGLFATGASYYAYRIKTNQRNVLEEKVNERTKELFDTNTELGLSNKELERSNEELERFAYIASHDLKQPLNTIISFSGLLNKKLKGKLDDDSYGHLQLILNGGKQMKKLIEDLLEYSKTGHERMAPEWIDLNVLVEDVKLAISDYIDHSNADITISKALPSIFAEKTKMFLVFKNLIENGIKFNLSVKPSVELSYAKEGNKSVLSFKDNGIGIKEDYHKTVFKMFKRLHAKNEYDGTGLGLSLCKRIIVNMEGTIFLEESGEEGSIFSVELPADLFKEMAMA